MSDPLEQSSVKASNRFFALWVVVGLLLVIMAVVGEYTRPRRPPGYPTFQFVGGEAEYEAQDRRLMGLRCLAYISPFYGILGGALFYRRGCRFPHCGCGLLHLLVGTARCDVAVSVNQCRQSGERHD
jgi:hypothetical protein